jgi:formate-dependent nitrite reductase membrane component NrfD
VVCPEEAIIVGNLNDPQSEVSQIVARQKVDVRKPEKGTSPKVFYLGANEATLSPTLAQYQGAHLWSVQKEGYPVAENHSTVRSVAAARINYDVPHKGVAWDWKVSLYTWTKSIASGLFLVFAFLGLLGYNMDHAWSITVAVVGGIFLALTGLLLIAKLSHPWRFYRIFTRPQWKSWLVRGAFIILLYGLVLLLLFVAGATASNSLVSILWWPGIVLAGLTAIYTAFLLSQSKGRDLWQNALLPVHMFVQAILAGSATFILLSALIPLQEEALSTVQSILLGSALVYLALVISEGVMPHVTADAALAAKQMIKGRYRGFYWSGLIAGGILPVLFIGVDIDYLASFAALAGLMLYEHSYMQAGQSVPLS